MSQDSWQVLDISSTLSSSQLLLCESHEISDCHQYIIYHRPAACSTAALQHCKIFSSPSFIKIPFIKAFSSSKSGLFKVSALTRGGCRTSHLISVSSLSVTAWRQSGEILPFCWCWERERERERGRQGGRDNLLWAGLWVTDVNWAPYKAVAPGPQFPK